MKRNRKNAFISITLGMLLVFSTFAIAFAETDETSQVATGEENTDAVTDQIIAEGDYTIEQEDEIADDIDNLDSLGIPIDNIDDVSEEHEGMLYSVKMTNTVTDKINIDEQNNGDIVMDIDEGENIHDELVVKENGDMYLDGNKIIVENESNNENVTPSIYYTWYTASKVPSRIKNEPYGSYSRTWVCSNINLQKAIRDTSIGAILGVVNGGVPGAAWGGAAAAIQSLRYIGGKSKHMSYMDYTARGKRHKNYLKRKKVLYAYAKFNGKATTMYAYAA